MTDYISREAVNALIKAECSPKVAAYLNDCVATIPAADVRPVVLCKDCKYSYDSVGGWCCSHGICVDCIVHENFFCADGVKREES